MLSQYSCLPDKTFNPSYYTGVFLISEFLPSLDRALQKYRLFRAFSTVLVLKQATGTSYNVAIQRLNQREREIRVE